MLCGGALPTLLYERTPPRIPITFHYPLHNRDDRGLSGFSARKLAHACCVTRLGCPSTKAENFPKRENLQDLTSGLFVIPFYFLLPFSSHNSIIIIIILRFIDWDISHGTPFYALKFLLFDPDSFRLGNFLSTRLS